MIRFALRPAALALLIAMLALGCGGPFVLLPGGELEGEVVAVPDSWVFTDDIDTIQLETNPAEPYSVNIWVVALGDGLYVHAGANRAEWIEHMEADPAVRLRADESIYELSAARVEAQDEFDRFSDAYESEAYLDRLTAR